MKKKKGKCLVCRAEMEWEDCVYADIGKETMVFSLCGEHGPVIARFLEGSGLADRTSIPWRDALQDNERRRNDPRP